MNILRWAQKLLVSKQWWVGAESIEILKNSLPFVNIDSIFKAVSFNKTYSLKDTSHNI